MPTRVPRTVLPALTAALLGIGAMTSAPAHAQDPAATAGPAPRYMTWAGRPAATTPADVSARARVRSDVIARRTAPSRAVDRPAMRPAPLPRPTSAGLTPASAWLSPPATTPFMPGSPDPLAHAREMAAPSPAAATPAVPMPVASASTAMAEPMPAADPMAPRADAPVFRLRRPTVPAASEQAPAVAAVEASAPAAPPSGQPGARYYSVHREAGLAPDRAVLPQAVFYDSVALDLAEPPPAQAPLRDAQGRLRAPARDEDPDRP